MTGLQHGKKLKKRKHHAISISFNNSDEADKSSTENENTGDLMSRLSFLANSSLYFIGITSDFGQLFINQNINHFEYLNNTRGFTGINFNKELSLLGGYSSTLKTISRNSVLGGAVLDFGIGVPVYYYNQNNPFAVSPTNATVNLSIAAYSYYVSPPVGILYFGINLFYPGGWKGAMEMQGTLIRENQKILGPGWNMFK